MKVWIDNDGCPAIVSELVLAGSERRKVAVIVVANTPSKLPANPLFSTIQVSRDFDAADDYIAEHVEKNDLVITSDVPLASRVVAKGAVGISAYGQIFDSSNIADLLSTRNLLQELRGGGLVTGGSPTFGPAGKKQFADSFDRLMTKLKR